MRALVFARREANSASLKGVLFLPNSIAAPFYFTVTPGGRAGQNLGPARAEQHRVGDEVVAAPRPHQPGEDVEAHARLDLDVAVAAQARHPVAARPARRHADADHVAAMMAPIVRRARPDPRRPARRHRRRGTARRAAWRRGPRANASCCHRRHARGPRRARARHAPGGRAARGSGRRSRRAPGRRNRPSAKRVSPQVVCSSPSRAVERMNGPNPGGAPPAIVIARWHSAATSRSLAPARMRSIAACAAASETRGRLRA